MLPDKIPQFFKVFLPDHCSEKIRIPDAFLAHLSDKIPKLVILRNRVGNVWPVTVAETEDGVFLKEGWLRFVSDNSLQVGEFLVFKYNGHHKFDVLILGTSGCEKELISRPLTMSQEEKDLLIIGEDEEDEEEEESYSVSGYCAEKLEKGIEKFLPSKNPFFVTKLRLTRSGEVTVPHETRKDFDLKFSERIELQDPEGRIWMGRVVCWKDGRVWIKDGWKKLCKWNKVTDNDTLICEFMPTTERTTQLIKVQIIRA